MYDAHAPHGRLPARPGVGYKRQHHAAILAEPGPVGWVEIHAENHMGDGGPALRDLRAVRERFAVSCHGVGLSIGAERGLDAAHLGRLRRLVEWLEPASVSEHLAWSTHEAGYLNDLLPLPYTEATLERVSLHVSQLQDALGRRILLENPSSYVAFAESEMDELTFLAEVVRRSGCGLLLDVNNVFVSATNLGFSPEGYIDGFPLEAVGEVHLGGHDVDADETGAPLLIDSHGRAVVDPVWALFARVIGHAGPLPTLIEWDNDVPEWPVLRAEAERADAVLAGA